MANDTDPQAAARLADLGAAALDGDAAFVVRAVRGLHPADAADLLEQLSEPEIDAAIGLLGDAFTPDMLIALRDEVREDAVESLPDAAVAEAAMALDSDDAAALLGDLGEERLDKVLAEIGPAERAGLRRALAYPDDSAGRLMQTEFVAVPEHWTVGEAIDHARAQRHKLPEPFYEIYVVDPAMRPTGCVSLSLLLRSARSVPLRDIQVTLESDISAGSDQEDVAFQFQKYSLASAPVKGPGDRIVGMITVDDMVQVIQEENTEDLLALSNVSSADGSDTVLDRVKARAPWLALNLVTAFLASIIIAAFDATIERVVALAVLMPVVAALGGNAGSQGLAVAVRALAERELSGVQARRAVLREAGAGLVHGVLFAAGTAAVAYGWFGDARLAAVIAAAMFATCVWAGLSGILVPLALKRAGADPAVASSVFVLTLTDTMAFFSFLGLATLAFPG